MQIGALDVRLDAEDPLPGLPVVAGLHAAKRAERRLIGDFRKIRGWRVDGGEVTSDPEPGIDADIEAGPVVNRRHGAL